MLEVLGFLSVLVSVSLCFYVTIKKPIKTTKRTGDILLSMLFLNKRYGR